MILNNTYQYFLIIINFLIIALLSSCMSGGMLVKTEHVKSHETSTYKGWWIYGDGEHIFKDEKTLKEYSLKFEKETLDDITNLYLDICEIEYFPMESAMTGYIGNGVNSSQNVLVVSDFEILYVEGCGE
tara:strand:- start:5181 stop:5567 length:387 start_codon:yes stop_codon:yes gene_type:complete